MVYRSSRAPGSRGRSEDDGSRPHNVFRNDGSFLEMFKKMQGAPGGGAPKTTEPPAPDSADETDPASPGPSAPSGGASGSPAASGGLAASGRSSAAGPEPPRPPKAPFVGKRRGGRVLPTGKVKRLKPESDSPADIPKDAWSAYLAEVKRYKETTCEEDGKTRPLVK